MNRVPYPHGPRLQRQGVISLVTTTKLVGIIGTITLWEPIAMEKSKVQQVLDSQPDDVDVDAFMERLYVLQKIAEAERQLSSNQGIPHEEATQRLAAWLK